MDSLHDASIARDLPQIIGSSGECVVTRRSRGEEGHDEKANALE